MTAFLVALVVIPGTVGDLLNAAGMKRHGEITDWNPHALLLTAWDILRNPYILAGVPAMALSFFALMALLSTQSVSFAVPVTSSSYIVECFLAKCLLKEHVDWRRWVGVVLVAVGVGLLAI